MGRGLVDGGRITMARFVGVLSDVLGRAVADKTGFTGTFDVHLQFAPDQTIADPIIGGQSSPDSAAPSILTALQEQLGLRLESGRGQVEVLVIDSVERVSAN